MRSFLNAFVGPTTLQGRQLSLPCRFTWTKDGKPFNLSDSRITVSNNSGTFRISNDGRVSHFQGKYRCFASNRLGVAMSEEIEFVVPSEYCHGRFVVQALLHSVK